MKEVTLENLIKAHRDLSCLFEKYEFTKSDAVSFLLMEYSQILADSLADMASIDLMLSSIKKDIILLREEKNENS